MFTSCDAYLKTKIEHKYKLYYGALGWIDIIWRWNVHYLYGVLLDFRVGKVHMEGTRVVVGPY